MKEQSLRLPYQYKVVFPSPDACSKRRFSKTAVFCSTIFKRLDKQKLIRDEVLRMKEDVDLIMGRHCLVIAHMPEHFNGPH